MASKMGEYINNFVKKHVNMNINNCKDQIKSIRSADNYSFFRKPIGYTYEKLNIDNLKIEILKKKGVESKNLIYVLHGGAYIGGLSDMYRIMGKKYSRAGNNSTIVFLDYRVAPENVYPCALEDALNGWNWILGQGYKEENIMLIGDSAGGHLAISLVLKLQEKNRLLPVSLICLSPWTDMTCSGWSYAENYKKDVIFGADLEYNEEEAIKFRTAPMFSYFAKEDRMNPYISLIYANYKNFPPMLIISGSDEMLLSDSEIIVNKLKEAGCEIQWDVTKDMFHDFAMYNMIMPESKKAMTIAYDYIIKFLN
jgi:acetyl esterase/lipase